MPRDDDRRRHRKHDSSADRERKQNPKDHRRREESSSKHRRKHHEHLSDDEKVTKHEKDRKKRRHEDSNDSDERSSSTSGSHGHRRKKSSHRHERKRGESNDRRKSDRKHDDRKKKKTKRKHSRREDSSDDDERVRRKSSKPDVKSRRVDKSTLYPMGDPVGFSPKTLVDPERDYFTYHQEFWVYLFREEGVRFNDLQSDEARTAFGRFAVMYNEGKLEAAYYENPPSFPPQVLEESKTTRHVWGFQTTAAERKGLENLQEGVRRLTQYKEVGDESTKEATVHSTRDIERKSSHDPSENRHKTPEQRMEEHRRNKRLRESVRTAQEEITGGAKDFRAKQIEKKREEADRIHGAARDKEEGGAGVELTDDAIYGDGDRSFHNALARERQFKARKEEMRNARVEELKNKEQERQSNMLKMLGLDGVKPGQRIQIAPRKDG